MDSKKIAIIGSGSIGKTVAMAIAENTNNICVLHDVVDIFSAELKEQNYELDTKVI